MCTEVWDLMGWSHYGKSPLRASSTNLAVKTGAEVSRVTSPTHTYIRSQAGALYCMGPAQVEAAAMPSYGFIFASSFNPDQKHLKVLMVLGQTES